MARFCFVFSLLVFLAACTPPHAKSTAATTKGQPQDDIASARQLRRSGKPAEAVALLQEAVKTQPDNPKLLSQLGYAQIANNQSPDAVRTFDRLLAVNPENAAAYDGKAMAFDHAGNHLAAQDLYQQALTLAPDSVRIQNNLAVSLILNGQLDQAIAQLEQLNTIAGSNRTVRQNLALAYGLSGQDDKALALNLQDLPAQQAKENMRFYDAYRKRQSFKAADAAAPKHIGFADGSSAATDETEKTPAPPKKPSPEKEPAPSYMLPADPAGTPASPADSAMPLPAPPQTVAPPPAVVSVPLEPVSPASPAINSGSP